MQHDLEYFFYHSKTLICCYTHYIHNQSTNTTFSSILKLKSNESCGNFQIRTCYSCKSYWYEYLLSFLLHMQKWSQSKNAKDHECLKFSPIFFPFFSDFLTIQGTFAFGQIRYCSPLTINGWLVMFLSVPSIFSSIIFHLLFFFPFTHEDSIFLLGSQSSTDRFPGKRSP